MKKLLIVCFVLLFSSAAIAASRYIEKPEIVDKIKNFLRSLRPNGSNHWIPS